MAVAAAWDRVHARLTHRAAWLDHDGDLPVIEGALIRLHVDHLPGDRDPKPVWLWSSSTGAAPGEVDGLTPCVGCRQGDERAAAIAESGFTGKLERNGPVRGRSTERAAKDFARLTSMGEQSGGRTERLLSDRSLWPDLIQAAA